MIEIEQIKVALEKVNEGTWIAQEDCQICKGNGFTIFDTEAGFERDECPCLMPESRIFNSLAPERMEFLITTIESQNEEIEKIKRALSNAGEFVARGLIEDSKLREEIESLKAITELAVKGLKEIREVYSLFEDESPGMKIIAENTLSEIERLQNE